MATVMNFMDLLDIYYIFSHYYPRFQEDFVDLLVVNGMPRLQFSLHFRHIEYLLV